MLQKGISEKWGKELTSKETNNAMEVIKRLKKEYPNARTRLVHKNTFQLLIATILSARATDEQVNAVTKKLFKKYKTPAQLAKVDLHEIKKIVKSAGYFNQKAKRIKEASRIICTKYNNKVPDSMSELVKLPGVGRKTANIVLSYGFGKDEGIAVDTHVFRLSKRLGLSNGSTPQKVELDLMKLIPKKEWSAVNTSFIFHGRKICNARNPKHKECILFDICPSRNI